MEQGGEHHPYPSHYDLHEFAGGHSLDGAFSDLTFYPALEQPQHLHMDGDELCFGGLQRLLLSAVWEAI